MILHNERQYSSFRPPPTSDILPKSFTKMFVRLICLLLGVAAIYSAGAALTPQQLRQLPPPVSRKVDFARDIQPIIEVSCTQCHARGKDKGGLSMETRAAFLKGGDSGVVVVPGKSAESYVIETISGLNPDNVMPQKGKKLTREQVALFRAWIDQGLPWPGEINFAKHEPANLKPRSVTLPPAKKGLEHPVDRLVDAYFAQRKIRWPRIVDDRTFARRVWLDTIGLLPPPKELQEFLSDRAPDKRAQLVHRLLSNNQAYAEHWLTFWNDLLRNDYKGTGYIDGGRKQITGWLYTALARNLPYDRFVSELIDPAQDSDGFTRGILWRGAVNASMVPPMQAAQSVSQVFLGVNLKCASCHDSFINEYTLKDAYGLAAVFADGPLEIAECDKPSGHVAQVKFLYNQLGVIDGQADRPERLRQLAGLLTGKDNGRLSRTLVNRLWQRFFGHGLVPSVDEMDHRAWHPELLDWLAEDFVAHGYDLKHLIARMLTSRAYQLPTVNLGEQIEDYVFRGPAIRRLSAEQFLDALVRIADLDYAPTGSPVNRLAALNPDPPVLPQAPKWIWNDPRAAQATRPASVNFRRVIVLDAAPTEAFVTLLADNEATLFVNGKNVGQQKDSSGARQFDVKSALKKGTNVIAVTAVNLQPSGRRPVPTELTEDSDNPAGLLLYARVRAGKQVMDFVSNAEWITGPGQPEGWNRDAAFKARTWVAAVELGDVRSAPWKVGERFLALAAAPPDKLPVERASLVAADPLMVALGRPNREQITPVRQSTATTLQALELTNGSTLASLLKRGAEKLLDGAPSGPALVESLYWKALGRKPTAAENRIAMALAGSPASAEGVEDLLWSLAMLPEFQLIH
jgi:mono/diheme cytochrome c family protein